MAARLIYHARRQYLHTKLPLVPLLALCRQCVSSEKLCATEYVLSFDSSLEEYYDHGCPEHNSQLSRRCMVQRPLCSMTFNHQLEVRVLDL
jgi:hypothetical protein